MLLLAERELDHAVSGDFAAADHLAFVADRLVVDADRTALDVTAGFAVRRGKAGTNDQRQQADAAVEFGGRDIDRGQVLREAAFLEGFARRFGSLFSGLAAVQDRRYLGRKDLLDLVDLRTEAVASTTY